MPIKFVDSVTGKPINSPDESVKGQREKKVRELEAQRQKLLDEADKVQSGNADKVAAKEREIKDVQSGAKA